MPSVGIKYRPDIQGLRAIAVAVVVLSHARISGFSGGFVGVDVFFVLSGYLITGLLVEERLKTGTVFYGRFLARRVRRLLPAMLVMLVSVLAIGSAVLTAYEMRMQSGSFAYAATWTSNFFFAFAERDYFSALQAEDLFLHTWSLGVEEQFYLVWPWLIILFAGLTARDTSSESVRNVMLGALAIVATASFAVSIYVSSTIPILSFYMMPARGWQFALGAAVYIGLRGLAKSDDDRSSRWQSAMGASIIAIVGILLVIGSTYFLTANINYPGYYAIFPSLGAALVIAAGNLSGSRGVSGALGCRPLVWIGDRSYSIYLWHWPILILGNSFGLSKIPYGAAALISVSILVAAVSYRYVEYPFWKGALSKAASPRVALFAFMAIILAFVIAELLERNVYADSRGAIDLEPNSSSYAPDSKGYDPRKDLPFAVYSSGRDCDSGIRSAELIPCSITAGDGESVAVLLGDSIGAQWSPMVAGILTSPDWQVIVLTKSACAIVDQSFYYGAVGDDYRVCADWRSAALRYIDRIKPKIVVVGSSAAYEFSKEQWVNGSSRVLEGLSKVADHVVVIPGTPSLSFDGPSCLEDPYRFSFRLIDGLGDCEENEADNGSKNVTTYLAQSAEHLSNVSVLNLGDLVCPNQICAAQSNNEIAVYRDQDHLTATFVKSLIPEVRNRFEAIGIIVSSVQIEE